jgi:replicative superfamily II helicase
LQTEKLNRNENGELVSSDITTPQAKQIAGRAGRYGAGQDVGLVTAFTEKRMGKLKDIIKQEVEDIKVRNSGYSQNARVKLSH